MCFVKQIRRFWAVHSEKMWVVIVDLEIFLSAFEEILTHLAKIIMTHISGSGEFGNYDSYEQHRFDVVSFRFRSLHEVNTEG